MCSDEGGLDLWQVHTAARHSLAKDSTAASQHSAPVKPAAPLPYICRVCGADVKYGSSEIHEMLPRHVAAALRCGAALREELQRHQFTMGGRKLLVAVAANKKHPCAFCSVCGRKSLAPSLEELLKIFCAQHRACFLQEGLKTAMKGVAFQQLPFPDLFQCLRLNRHQQHQLQWNRKLQRVLSKNPMTLHLQYRNVRRRNQDV